MSPDLERLVGRAILDPTFRERLLSDPDGAVKDGGFTLTPDEMDQVREAIRQRVRQGIALDDKITDAAAGGVWA